MIGLWVARFVDRLDGALLTKFHYVESEIADRKVTHCGRQLGDIPGTVLAPLLKPSTTQDTCSDCAPMLTP